uniref:Putative lipocalin-5 1 n=1 Tax=Amblyomma cajennense TaxID=34607 RepID=A0A023FRT3_AMBCJ
MEMLWAVAFTAISLGGIANGKLGPPGGPLKLPRDSFDSFKAMSQFEYLVAISDSNNDTVFECLAAKRTNIDQEAKTATYTFLLPTAGMELSFHIKPGDEPATGILTSNVDPSPREGIIYYTDYQNCVVANLEIHGDGNQCTLWARLEVKDNVPQVCIDHFVDVCGVTVPAHSRDLCPDGEGDY